MALLGMIATYAVVVMRGDTGAPLWQAQTMFAIYWLLFETFDMLASGSLAAAPSTRPDSWASR